MKKLQKLISIFITLFFIGFNNVYAADYGKGFTGIPISKMQQMDLKKVFEVPDVGNYYHVQGMTVTDKYFVVSIMNGEDDGCLRAYDKWTYKLVKTVKGLKIGHGNDLTYNPKTNKIYCAQAKKTVAVINAETLNFERYISTDHSSSAIAYDTKNDRYLLTNGNYAYYYDNNFKYTGTRLNIATKLTRQNVSYYNGYYFRTCWESGQVGEYQKEYEGILRRWDNLVYVFDEKANLKNTWYIPQENVYGEIESITLRDGVPFIIYNGGNVYIPIWKEIKKAITLKVTSDDLDVSKITNKATLYDSNGKALSTKSISNGKYTFDAVSYSKRGTFNYTIKIDTNKVNVDKSNISTSVKVTYNSVYNKLEFDTYKEETVKINSVNTPINTPTPTPTHKPAQTPTITPTPANQNGEIKPSEQDTNGNINNNPQTGAVSIIFILLLASVCIILAYSNKITIDNNN